MAQGHGAGEEEAGWRSRPLAPGLLFSSLCHILFLEQHPLWWRCPNAGDAAKEELQSVFPRLNGRDKSLPPTVSLSQFQLQLSSFLFCPLSSPEAQPEAHCHGFLSPGNDLHFHSSRKFCLWTFLNMIFNGCLWNTLNLPNIQHKAIKSKWPGGWVQYKHEVMYVISEWALWSSRASIRFQKHLPGFLRGHSWCLFLVRLLMHILFPDCSWISSPLPESYISILFSICF